MNATKRWLLALAVGAAVVVVPGLVPTGPVAGLDASQFLGSGRLAAGAAIVFLGGLLTALTPCVYPLIPITVGVFGARQAASRARALGLTSAYVAGMGVVFSTLGVLAARTGAAFGAILGNPVVVILLAAFLLVLASSMFGAFEIALPSGLLQRLNGVGGAGVVGALLMGSVAGFLAAPCTGPVLTGLLAFVAKTQSVGLGAGLLFIYALGIGVPFFLIGVFTVQLPRGGAWMEWVKSALGIVLVALAASYLRDAFPALREPLQRAAGALGRGPGLLVVAGLTVAGVALGAIHRSFKAGAAEALLKGVGVLAVVVAVVLRLSTPGASGPDGQSIPWLLTYAGPEATSGSPLERALAEARASGRPVLIDFFAEWCAACKELDRETYVAPEVVAEARRFLAIKVDGTTGQDALDALYAKFGVNGLPTVAFVSSKGEILQEPRVTGFLPPQPFLAELRRVR